MLVCSSERGEFDRIVLILVPVLSLMKEAARSCVISQQVHKHGNYWGSKVKQRMGCTAAGDLAKG